ncbi:DUF2478 domain-containing protein [Consotaella salsifontis]|uniref:Nucleoside-triphosphatase THEP1 n=1 Tax=Consotaella salsifontis TaxID=1365950 RepID=A0A1T4NY64_9HYPH|nr:DUF2478 domain-containing protein [Consotaella salsifontis]SJZ84159.1 Protein of unknown function [Consotaella salsifontis]
MSASSQVSPGSAETSSPALPLMFERGPFDSGREVWLGAIATDDRAGLDRQLGVILSEMKGRGARIIGLLQTVLDDSDCDCSKLAVRDLASDELIPITQFLGHESHSCRLDTRRLAEVSGLLEKQIEPGVELLLINRFGKVEAEGHGLRDLICQAIELGIPTLVTVQTSHLDAWASFESGLAQYLPPEPEVVRAWCEAAVKATVERKAIRV